MKKRYLITKEVELLVLAVEAREAEECATQFLNAELSDKDNGLGVDYRSQKTLKIEEV